MFRTIRAKRDLDSRTGNTPSTELGFEIVYPYYFDRFRLLVITNVSGYILSTLWKTFKDYKQSLRLFENVIEQTTKSIRAIYGLLNNLRSMISYFYVDHVNRHINGHVLFVRYADPANRTNS